MTRTTRRMAIPAAFASAVAAVPLVIVACNAEPPSAAADLEEIRVEMFFAATKIELFRADVGNLPETLVVGIPGDSFRQGGPIVTIAGIDFTRRGESAYSLTSSVASEILSYDSSSDNPYSWLGLDDASGTGPSWDGTSDTRERHARLLASGFAEGLYRNRADLLGWSDEAPGRPSPTAILRVILTAVESSDLSMTLEEIAAANGELSDLRLRYSEDYPRIQELQRQVDTGRLTPDLDRIVNELKARAAEVSG